MENRVKQHKSSPVTLSVHNIVVYRSIHCYLKNVDPKSIEYILMIPDGGCGVMVVVVLGVGGRLYYNKANNQTYLQRFS